MLVLECFLLKKAAAARYDIISVPFIRRRRISSREVRYHTEGISPVPAGTDIIEKSVLCLLTKDAFFMCKYAQKVRNQGKCA